MKHEFSATIFSAPSMFSGAITNPSDEGSLLRMGNSTRARENPLKRRERLQQTLTLSLKMLKVTRPKSTIFKNASCNLISQNTFFESREASLF